ALEEYRPVLVQPSKRKGLILGIRMVYGTYRAGCGLGDSDFQFIVPIRKDLAIVFLHKSYECRSMTNAPDDFINELNGFIARSSKQVASHSRQLLTAVLRRERLMQVMLT
ncbi:MAG: hypothetical protein AAF825_06075, partial [Pseudomonadota bacterium]